MAPRANVFVDNITAAFTVVGVFEEDPLSLSLLQVSTLPNDVKQMFLIHRFSALGSRILRVLPGAKQKPTRGMTDPSGFTSCVSDCYRICALLDRRTPMLNYRLCAPSLILSGTIAWHTRISLGGSRIRSSTAPTEIAFVEVVDLR